jgi:proteic killer suppression protein
MILSFGDPEVEKLFQERKKSRKLPEDIQRIALRKLLMIHASSNINDLRVPPSNHLEKLKGNRKHQHSIRINDQWRICFTWKQNNAFDVTIEDYH